MMVPRIIFTTFAFWCLSSHYIVAAEEDALSVNDTDHLFQNATDDDREEEAALPALRASFTSPFGYRIEAADTASFTSTRLDALTDKDEYVVLYVPREVDALDFALSRESAASFSTFTLGLFSLDGAAKPAVRLRGASEATRVQLESRVQHFAVTVGGLGDEPLTSYVTVVRPSDRIGSGAGASERVTDAGSNTPLWSASGAFVQANAANHPFSTADWVLVGVGAATVLGVCICLSLAASRNRKALVARMRAAVYRAVGCVATALVWLARCVCCCFWWRSVQGRRGRGEGAAHLRSESLNSVESAMAKGRKVSDDSDMSSEGPNLEEDREFDHRKSSMLVTDGEDNDADDDDDEVQGRRADKASDGKTNSNDEGAQHASRNDIDERPSRLAWLSTLFSRRSRGGRSSGAGIGDELLPRSLARSDAKAAASYSSSSPSGRRRRSAPVSRRSSLHDAAAAAPASSSAYPAQAYAMNSRAAATIAILEPSPRAAAADNRVHRPMRTVSPALRHAFEAHNETLVARASSFASVPPARRQQAPTPLPPPPPPPGGVSLSMPPSSGVSVRMPPAPRAEVTRESLPDPLIPEGKSLQRQPQSQLRQTEQVILGSIVDPLASSGSATSVEKRVKKARSEIKIKLEDLQDSDGEDAGVHGDEDADLVIDRSMKVELTDEERAASDEFWRRSEVLYRSIDEREKEHEYKCQHCNLTFSQKGNFTVHQRIHRGDRSHTCDICGKKFARKQTLVNHIDIHLNRKPHGCDVCGRKFTQKSQLARHIRTHTGAKPFPCRCCSKKFSDKRNLISHIKNRHTSEAPGLLAMLKNPRRGPASGAGANSAEKKKRKKKGANAASTSSNSSSSSSAKKSGALNNEENAEKDLRMPHLSDSSTSPERETVSASARRRGASSDTEHLTFAASTRRHAPPLLSPASARNTRSTSSEASASSASSSHFSTLSEHSSSGSSHFSLSRSPPREPPKVIIAAPHNPPSLRIQAALSSRFPPPLLPTGSSAGGSGLDALPPPLVVKMEGFHGGVPSASAVNALPPPLTLGTKGSSFDLPPLLPLPNHRQGSLTDVDELPLHAPKPEVAAALPPLPLLPLPLTSTSAGMQSLPPLPLPSLPSAMKPEQGLVAPLQLLPLPLPLGSKHDINALGSVNVGPLAVDHHPHHATHLQDSYALQPSLSKRPTSPVSPSDPFLSGPTDLRHSFKEEAPLTPPASMTMTDIAQPQLSVAPSLSAAEVGDLPSFLSMGGGTTSELMSYDSSANLAMGVSHDMHMSSSATHFDSSETVTNSSIVGMDMLGDGMSMSMSMHDDSHAAAHSTLSSAHDALSPMIADDDDMSGAAAATSGTHPNFADDISVFHDPYDINVLQQYSTYRSIPPKSSNKDNAETPSSDNQQEEDDDDDNEMPAESETTSSSPPNKHRRAAIYSPNDAFLPSFGAFITDASASATVLDSSTVTSANSESEHLRRGSDVSPGLGGLGDSGPLGLSNLGAGRAAGVLGGHHSRTPLGTVVAGNSSKPPTIVDLHDDADIDNPPPLGMAAELGRMLDEDEEAELDRFDGSSWDVPLYRSMLPGGGGGSGQRSLLGGGGSGHHRSQPHQTAKDGSGVGVVIKTEKQRSRRGGGFGGSRRPTRSAAAK